MPRTPNGVKAKRRKALIAAQHGLCHWCGTEMALVGPRNMPNKATIDHVVPRALGGATTRASGNLVAACLRCNGKRGASLGPPAFR